MYGQNSRPGTGVPRQGLQSGARNRNNYGRDFSTERMEDQQEQYQDPDQEQLNNPTPEPIPQASRDPQYNGSYVVIPPDQARRNKLLTIANKEEEQYNNYLESLRPGPIQLTPQKLGGHTAEAKARQQQQLQQSQSKYKKKFQRDEYIRKQREEEEAKLQQMKDIQRKKAEKLEEKRCLEERERRERLNESMLKKNGEFLDTFSQSANSSSPYSYGKQPRAWERSLDYKEEQDWNKYTEEDDDKAFQIALKESLKMKMEEDQRTQMEKNRPWQANQESYRQQLMEEEERKLQKMKEEPYRKASQKSYSSYKQQMKEEEERKLQEMKDEQRRKSELLAVKKAEEGRERQLSHQEERRRVNNAFLDKLQRLNTRQHEYTGESNTWA